MKQHHNVEQMKVIHSPGIKLMPMVHPAHITKCTQQSPVHRTSSFIRFFGFQEEKEAIRKYMEMVAQREAKAEEERLRKKAAADAAFKAVVEQTEKQNNEEDELRILR